MIDTKEIREKAVDAIKNFNCHTEFVHEAATKPVVVIEILDALKLATDALEFYAKRETYEQVPCGYNTCSPAESDEGARAHTALTKIKEMVKL